MLQARDGLPLLDLGQDHHLLQQPVDLEDQGEGGVVASAKMTNIIANLIHLYLHLLASLGLGLRKDYIRNYKAALKTPAMRMFLSNLKFF